MRHCSRLGSINKSSPIWPLFIGSPKSQIYPLSALHPRSASCGVSLQRSTFSFTFRCIFLKRTFHSLEGSIRRTNMLLLADTVAKCRFRFAGHVLRQPPQHPPKITMSSTPARGKRKRGRPKQTWRRTFEANLRAVDLAWQEAEETAANRVHWRALNARCAD